MESTTSTFLEQEVVQIRRTLMGNEKVEINY